MRYLTISLPVIACFAVVAQHSPSSPSTEPDVMLAAVSRTESLLNGGIGSDKWTGRGTVVVEPLALITASGEWRNLTCSGTDQKGCRKFAREYLSKPHAYTVVSRDGNGAIVNAASTTLSECLDFAGVGTYTGAALVRSAIAASSGEYFIDARALPRPNREESAVALKAIRALIPVRLDSTEYLRLVDLSLEGHHMLVIERAFADIVVHRDPPMKWIFAIGTLDHGRFNLLHWKENVEDEQERVLGTFGLRSGREFLVTV